MSKHFAQGVDVRSVCKLQRRICVTEAVEGDMLADNCSRDELGDYMAEDVRRQGGEDGPAILDTLIAD